MRPRVPRCFARLAKLFAHIALWTMTGAPSPAPPLATGGAHAEWVLNAREVAADANPWSSDLATLGRDGQEGAGGLLDPQPVDEPEQRLR
jgi:hypothetical protein